MTGQRQRLGIDIGGTFTDLVMVNEVSGAFKTSKVPSRPSDPALAVQDGIKQIIEDDGISGESIAYFVHGTTTALNTLIQRTGARTGLLITSGFADVLEIGRLRLPNPNDFMSERTEPLVPRYLVGEINERILATGDVLTPLNLDEISAAADALIEQGAQAIAICFLHAYRNDVHERQAAAHIREKYPDIYVTNSAATWPEQREYERALVTVMNAYLGGQLRTYFENLQDVASGQGIDCPLFTTKSNGGLMTAESAALSPVETLLSGPASGVVGALYVAQLAGFEQVISLDMGGTSADVAIIDRSVPYSTESKVGDFPVIMPTVEISSIGAGGGSVAWVDPAGVLKVGPHSAGATPGPVSYGRGGTEPTVTDAYVTLGIIDPERFLGGRMQLDATAARTAMSALGSRIGQSDIESAWSVLAVVTANMYAQLLPIMARKGVDPRDFALIAYGGAGPTQACLLARELGIKHVIVPRHPGLLCAFGSLVSDLKSDFIATQNVRTDAIEFSELEAQFAALEVKATNWLQAQLGHVERYELIRSADMRYRGQAFEISVTLKGDGRHAKSIADVSDLFHSNYETVYSQSDRSAPVEIVNIRTTIIGDISKPSFKEIPPLLREEDLSRARTRRVFLHGDWITAEIYDRKELLAGSQVAGPAIIEQDDTTVLLPPEMTATVDKWANIVVEVMP